MTRPFAVVTDSTADLPAGWASEYDIRVVPLRVHFGQESFRDGVDLTSDGFFRRLEGAQRLPTTSAPSPGDFAALYQELSTTCRECISIHLGSSISATVDSARLGAHGVDGFRVEVVDSRNLTMPMAFLCRMAAMAPDLDTALDLVRGRLDRLKVLALLDTLRYIEMGGRVSRAQAMVGGLLDVKPILSLVDGRISPVERVRTRSRAIPRLFDLLVRDAPLEMVGVVHAQAAEEAAELAERVRAEFPGVEVTMGQIGAVLGTHTGPRALGFGYIRR